MDKPVVFYKATNAIVKGNPVKYVHVSGEPGVTAPVTRIGPWGEFETDQAVYMCNEPCMDSGY